MVGSPKRKAMVLGVLLLVVFLCYVAVLGNDFTMDDREVAMGLSDGCPHPMVHDLQPLSEYFSSHYWRGHHDVDYLYRPVTVLSYALRFRAFGLHAIHSEVVVGIVGGAELLGFVFGAAPLLCWPALGGEFRRGGLDSCLPAEAKVGRR